MANAKENKRLLKKYRLRAEFIGVKNVDQMGKSALMSAIRQEIGVRNFMQHILHKGISNDWNAYVEKKNMSDSRAKRVFRNKKLNKTKRGATRPIYNPIDETLE